MTREDSFALSISNPDAIPFDIKPFQSREHFCPLIVYASRLHDRVPSHNRVRLYGVQDVPFRPIRQPRQHFRLAAFVFAQQFRVRTPDHTHPRSPPCLDSGHRIFKHETLTRQDLPLPFRPQVRIDAFERQQIDIRTRFPPPPGDALVIAQDALVILEGAEDGPILTGFQLVGVGVRGGGQGEVDVVVPEHLQQAGNPGERAGFGEEGGLVGALLGVEFGARDGELGPGMEDCCCLFWGMGSAWWVARTVVEDIVSAYLWSWTTQQFRLDRPRNVGAAVFL